MRPTWMQNTILVQDFKEKSGQKEDQKNYTRALPKVATS
jgi:hypothetical protein